MGRCRSCGFVAKHQKKFHEYVPGPVYFELQWNERREGHPFQGDAFLEWWNRDRDQASGTIPTTMVCFVRANQFDVDGDQEEAKAVLNEDRRCQKWFPYSPGRTPQQHLEDRQVLDMERRREEVNVQLASIAKDIQKSGVTAQAAQWKVSLGVGFLTVVVVGLVAWLFQPHVTNENNNYNLPAASATAPAEPTSMGG